MIQPWILCFLEAVGFGRIYFSVCQNVKDKLVFGKRRIHKKNCYSYREDLPLDWTFLLPFGSKLCQKPHSNYCFCFRAPAHVVVIVLLRSPDSGVPVSSWAVLLFHQTLWCKHIPRTLWCHQHLLCCEHAVYSNILFIYHWLRHCYLIRFLFVPSLSLSTQLIPLTLKRSCLMCYWNPDIFF